jgi:hemerythrin-like domain-containing protein
MLERLLLPKNHAIAILMKDHDAVKELFDRFEKSESSAQKEKIIAEALTELKIHAVIEEEIFYPAVRKHVGKDLMNEADEEHHVARVLIAELDRDGRSNDHRDAKFTVLAESVRHHIKEEEGEMLPKAKPSKSISRPSAVRCSIARRSSRGMEYPLTRSMRWSPPLRERTTPRPPRRAGHLPGGYHQGTAAKP